MEIVFAPEAKIDLQYWKSDLAMQKRITAILKDIVNSPFRGIGKPEPLKYDLAGLWSRRIDLEHRLVYQVDGDELLIYSCRYHYDKK